MPYNNQFLTILLLLIGFVLHGQGLLTKEEAIDKTLEYNLGIKIAANNKEIAANNALKGFFIHNLIHAEGTPPYLYTHLRTEVDEKAAEAIARKNFFIVL